MEGVQLTIVLSRTSVHVAEVFRSSKEIIRTESKVFDNVNEINVKEVLTNFFSTLNWSDNYEEYTLSWISSTATLVPTRIFEATDAKSVLDLVVGGKIDKNEVDYNRIVEQDIITIYEIPHWVKSFFIIKFPKIALYHAYTVNIRALFASSVFRVTFSIQLYEEHFMLLIAHKNQLVFSNQFDYQSKEDILYYLMFALQQHGLSEEKGTIHATFIDDKSKAVINDLFQLLKDKKIMTKFTVGSMDLAFKNQLSCV